MFLALITLASASPTLAEKGKLLERLTPDVMAVVYPGAERLGPEEGSPPAVAVYKGDKAVAYIFSTLDIVAAPGYSVTPFDVIAGVDLGGRITGAKVVFHREPYIYRDAVRQPLLDTFLAREAGIVMTCKCTRAITPIKPRGTAHAAATAPPIRGPAEGTEIFAWVRSKTHAHSRCNSDSPSEPPSCCAVFSR